MKTPKPVTVNEAANVMATIMNGADGGETRLDTAAKAWRQIEALATAKQTVAVDKWIAHLGAELDWQCDDVLADDESDEEQEYSSKMAKALAKARGSYIKSTASSGKKSLHNGDELAALLAGCEPEEACLLADLVCQDAAGTHSAKYAHLNQGQQRMNAGNKIRGRIKRGEILPSTVIEVANANLDTLKAAETQG